MLYQSILEDAKQANPDLYNALLTMMKVMINMGKQTFGINPEQELDEGQADEEKLEPENDNIDSGQEQALPSKKQEISDSNKKKIQKQ